MTVKEFYEQIEGNYEEALERFMDEARIIKFVKMFPNNNCYQDLCTAMQAKDPVAAFQAVHALKGITANIAFSKLNELCITITEELRGGSYTEVAEIYFDVLQSYYDKTIAAISQLPTT